MNLNTFKLISQLTDMNHSTTAYFKPASPKPLFTPVTIDQPFPRATPESEGISSLQILKLLQSLTDDPSMNMHSLLIIRNGSVITEVSWPGQDSTIPKMTFSACKSITALAIGFLIQEKKLTLDTRLTDIFDNHLNAIDRLRLRDLGIRHLLTMTSGLTFNEGDAMTESDWLKSCLSAPFKNTAFSYNSMNSYLLSAAVTEITGERLSRYLKKRLFDPLGIHEYYWETCPKGIDKGGWGLYIAPEDFGKIGWMVLQHGQWKGQSILPQVWLDEATAAHCEAPSDYGDFNYGYHIWHGRNNQAFLFNGMLGQNVLCLPEQQMVIVSNAGNDENFQKSRYFEYVKDAFSDRLVISSKNRKAQKNLSKYIHSLYTLPTWKRRPAKPGIPKFCRGIVDTTWYTENSPAVGLMPLVLQAVQNNYTLGLRSIRFEIRNQTLIMDYTEADETYSIAIGWKQAAISNILVHGEPYRIAAIGVLTEDEDQHSILKVQIHFQETPFTRILRFRFSPNSVSVQYKELPGESFIHNSLSLFMTPISEQPLIGAALQKLDTDYIDYKIDRMLAPVVTLSKNSH